MLRVFSTGLDGAVCAVVQGLGRGSFWCYFDSCIYGLTSQHFQHDNLSVHKMHRSASLSLCLQLHSTCWSCYCAGRES